MTGPENTPVGAGLWYNLLGSYPKGKEVPAMAVAAPQTQRTTQAILEAIEQLDVIELEKVARHVSKLRIRKGNGPEAREAELLKIARRRRPRAFQRRYRELMHRRQEETLTDAEYQELLRLTNEAEAFDTQRIKALTELAELRQTNLDTLMRDLGFLRRG
jgi:hypothetical protein